MILEVFCMDLFLYRGQYIYIYIFKLRITRPFENTPGFMLAHDTDAGSSFSRSRTCALPVGCTNFVLAL